MPQKHYTVRQVARLVGLSKSTVTRQIHDGRLAALRTPLGLKGQPNYLIFRDDLVRWLLESGFPTARLRTILNPTGMVVLVRTDAALECALGGTRTRAVQSLFQLGLALTEAPCWGVVVDMPACGTEESCRSLAELSRRADRPLLVGLHGDDGCEASPLIPQTFDAVLPRAADVGVLARSIMRLKPFAPSRDT
jgi:excisionase family DNA binding protein